MSASFPGAIKSFTPKVDDVDDVMAVDVNEVDDEIAAIETELGTDPAGTCTDVKTRLLRTISTAGDLTLANVNTLTIASGSITPTCNRVHVDTEGSAASDNLDTITAMGGGAVVLLQIVNDARVVTLRSVGNIAIVNNITLTSTTQIAVLLYDSTATKWYVMAVTNLGALNAVNVWTAENSWAAAEDHVSATLTGNYTLSAVHSRVFVDATAGAVTLTLPAVAACTDREYYIVKIDSSANHVILDGNASETINGATTYDLTTQYESKQIHNNGTAWYVL
jgi:hypothetical protein